ncbi:MAG: MTH1187 family thiamine-binding protein [Acidimicrobiia bacterium]|nr:MTH1187 family thiamine-binding protein [Acidimicrobiia bacterium]
MLAAFSITPIGAGESVSSQVAEAVRLVRESGLPNETNAMFTNVEGDWDEVMALIGRCVERVGEAAPRVSVVIKVDSRRGAENVMESKMSSLESHLDVDGADGWLDYP